jgi:hypothetical protein
MQENDLNIMDSNAINISTKLTDRKSEFIGSVGIGTNAEGKPLFKANVVFDTGSTNLWVASHLCHRCAINTANQELYNPRNSLSQESFMETADGSKNLHVYFGTGELEGPLHVDTYHVGPMMVKHQPFAMIRESSGLSGLPWMDGILGLAFPSMSFGKVKPFFDHVIEQKLLDHNEFAFFLSTKPNQPSAILWGGVDKNMYHGDIRMFPVTKPHYWSLELLDFKVGNTSMPLVDDDRPIRSLVVDSGTTFYTAPTGLHNRIDALITPNRHDCAKSGSLPSMTYVLRGADGEKYDLVVPQEAYLVAGHDGIGCQAGIMALDVKNKHGPLMVLGETFMRNFFTVFDRGDGNPLNARIGIAPANLDAVPDVETSGKSVMETNAQGEAMQSFEVTSGRPIVRRDAAIVRHQA